MKKYLKESNNQVKTRGRIFILDDLMDSCRLMPNWFQSILFILFLLLGQTFLVVTILYVEFVIFLQLLFIILLIRKNIVYRRISKMEIAVSKMVIWVHSKRDEENKREKRVIHLVLIITTIIIFSQVQDFRVLLINSLFCFLFFLKIAFYVPFISVRIIEDDRFLIINKKLRKQTEVSTYQIRSVEIKMNKITIETDEGKVDIPIDFYSNKEMARLKTFLKQINKFEVSN